MPPRHPIILLKSNQFNMTAVSVNRSILKLAWTSERSNSVQTTCDREYTSRTRQHQKSISNRQVILVTQRAKSAVVCPDQIWLRFPPDFPFLERSTYDLSKARMSLTPAIFVSIMARGSFSTNSFPLQLVLLPGLCARLWPGPSDPALVCIIIVNFCSSANNRNFSLT